jgi:hypothetical protein
MTGWLKLTNEQRKTSIEQAAIASGISTKAIEKDWWVTLTLKALFATEYADFLIFKGGTSLSKCWKLIQRFSEDIDIAIDPRVIGIAYNGHPTKSYLTRLKKQGCLFTSVTLKESLEKQLWVMGVPEQALTITAEEIKPTMRDKDPQTLFLRYISLYNPNPYLADEVKIEVSIRSKLEPHTKSNVQSILNEVYPNPIYAETPFEVQAVDAQKTFLEKAFLLHEEFKKSNPGKIRTERMSRHFYDLEKMMDTTAGNNALADGKLYLAVIAHRECYNTMKGLDYATLAPAGINFMPPADIIDAYKRDYELMREQMIYGDSLTATQLFNRIDELVKRFRAARF